MWQLYINLSHNQVLRIIGLRQDLTQICRWIYFDSGYNDWLLLFNVLSSPLQPYTIAQNVLEAFRRTWPESLREAPRFANIILAATLVLIANKLTLVEMPRLLTDPYYRNAMLQRTANAEVVRFFRTRYDRWGRERAIIAESVLNKVGALAINPTLRLILGQHSNALPFRRVMDEGQVLICNPGAGRWGDAPSAGQLDRDGL